MSQDADAVCQGRELLKQLLGLHLMAQQQLLHCEWNCQSWIIAVTITRRKGQQEKHLEIDWQLCMNLLPDGAGSSLLFVTSLPHGHGIVCVHFMHWYGQLILCLHEHS